METNMQQYRNSELLYRIVSKDSFALYNNFSWTLGLVLNLLQAFWLVRIDGGLVAEDDSKKLWLRIVSIFHASISAFFLIIWMNFRYPQRRKISREDFIFDNPGVDPKTLKSRFIIMVVKSLLTAPTPVNMSLHIVFSLLGSNFSPFLMTLNLILIINLSRTCKFVIQAITLHADQLVLTLVMTFFVIYSYTVLLG
jgi:hypothetical protein